ncbi:YozD family protein [Bacillus sp. JJ1474]|uniref:YozD family protein n=1 Tax=Bacillus sp. JJ1474 TaxID=3122955 RepID=UPI002FFDC7DF
MKEIEITIDTQEIEDYLFQELIKRGFVPSKIEVEEISDIVFDYLISKEVIEEEIR